jgi:tetratricopeptide (TPR) repeat protein
MPVRGLRKAKRLFVSGKFSKVIRLLEPEIFRYRESFTFYYLLGLSSLYNGERGGALSYLSRAHQLNDDDVNTLLGIAAIHLHKLNKEEAIKTWLRVLEIDSGNAVAQKGLNILRKIPEHEDLVAFTDSKKIYTLYPKIQSRRFINVLLISGFFLLCFFISIILLKYVSFPERKLRPEIEQYTLPDGKPSLIQLTGDFLFTFTEEEVRTIFNRAKAFFNEYRDNRALVEINRLLNSNASPDVKAIALAMKDHVYEPDFSTIKDSFSLETVHGQPLLYDSCYVMWKGRVGGLSIGEEKISFDFWVGDTNVFEGVVTVVLFFGARLENGQSVEVLGQIDTIDNKKIILNGKAIHRIK